MKEKELSDTPRTRRFSQWCRLSHGHDMAMAKEGQWVLYTDYADLEKQLSDRDAALARCVDFLDALARYDSAVFKEDISGAMRQTIRNLLESIAIRALKANPSA